MVDKIPCSLVEMYVTNAKEFVKKNIEVWIESATL
jgi:hypothetical protein